MQTSGDVSRFGTLGEAEQWRGRGTGNIYESQDKKSSHIIWVEIATDVK